MSRVFDELAAEWGWTPDVPGAAPDGGPTPADPSAGVSPGWFDTPPRPAPRRAPPVAPPPTVADLHARAGALLASLAAVEALLLELLQTRGEPRP